MTRKEAASLGGRARARALSPERRSEIAAQGFAALVARRFAGDKTAAIEWLIAKGLSTQDPCPWNETYPDPGPMPPAKG